MTRARDLADGADKDISGTLTLDDIVLSNDMSVADNGKVQFGAGSDLEISHNGTENVIDSNAGTLVLRSAGAGTIEMRDQGSQVLAQFNDNSDVKLYHNNNPKLATTNTGVDVTGNIVATGTTGGVAKLSLVAEEVHGEIEGINIGNNFGGLAFKTNSNGTTAERMRIDSSGKFRKDNTTVGSVSVTGSSTAYNTSSDYRLKENVADLTGASDRVQQLAPKRFNFIADADTTVDGFLAHEVQDIVPEAITGAKDAVDADGNPEYQGIDQSKLVPLLTAALQEALTKIDALETRIVALESN
jgi:hypothetical protein